MATLTVNDEGKIELPQLIAQHLGVRPGDQVQVNVLPNGQVQLQAAPSISRFFSSLEREKGTRPTIGEMNEIIAQRRPGGI